MNFKKHIFALLLCASLNLYPANTAQSENAIHILAATWFQKHSQDLTVCLTKYYPHFEAVLAIIDLQIQKNEELKKLIQNHKITNPLQKITFEAKAAKKTIEEADAIKKCLIGRLKPSITELYDIEDALLKQHIDICDITLKTREKIIDDIIKLYNACYDLVENIKHTHEKEFGPVPVKIQSKL